jgi:hypothetical protein
VAHWRRVSSAGVAAAQVTKHVTGKERRSPQSKREARVMTMTSGKFQKSFACC